MRKFKIEHDISPALKNPRYTVYKKCWYGWIEIAWYFKENEAIECIEHLMKPDKIYYEK